MAPSKTGRTISQSAFDEMVKENMDDIGMDPAEALEDAIETLTLQGVDLTGIVTCVPGEGGVDDNPVIKCLNWLKELNFDSDVGLIGDKDCDELSALLEKVCELCCVEGSGNAAIAVRNGGVELVCSLVSKLLTERALDSCLKAMSSILYDVQSTGIFLKSGGPKIVVEILRSNGENTNILSSGFSVVTAASTGNEILKETFMELKIDELMLQIMKGQNKGSVHSLYDAIRVLLTPDDNRVVASQVYGYARRFAKIGIAEALVESLHRGISSPSLVPASIALKAVAVNVSLFKWAVTSELA